MRILILFFFALVSCTSLTPVLQQIPYPIEREIEAKGKLKAELYLDSQIWMFRTFNSSKDVIVYSDKEYGVILGNYVLNSNSESSSSQNVVRAKIEIKVDDGKASIKVYTNDKWSSFVSEYAFTERKALIEMTELVNSFEEVVGGRYILVK